MSFDYAFMGDKNREGQSKEVLEEDSKDEAVDTEVMKLLMGRDAKSKVCCAIPVPQKGLDPAERSVREGLTFLKFLGYASVVLKSDQEPALRFVMTK